MGRESLCPSTGRDKTEIVHVITIAWNRMETGNIIFYWTGRERVSLNIYVTGVPFRPLPVGSLTGRFCGQRVGFPFKISRIQGWGYYVYEYAPPSIHKQGLILFAFCIGTGTRHSKSSSFFMVESYLFTEKLPNGRRLPQVHSLPTAAVRCVVSYLLF